MTTPLPEACAGGGHPSRDPARDAGSIHGSTATSAPLGPRVCRCSVLAFGGVLLLSYGAYGWAALFLVLGALNLGGGIWYLTVARSESGPKLSPRDPGTRAPPLAPDRHAQA